MELSKEQLEKYVHLSLTDEQAAQKIVEEYNGETKALLYVADYILDNEYKASFFREFSERDKKSAVKNLLKHRRRYLNNKFSWTEPDKHRFLHVNEHLIKTCETAWNEAWATALQWEERINKGDPFLKDYEIDVAINPYPGFIAPLNDNEDDLGYLSDHFAGLLLTDMSISHSHFEHRSEVEDWNLIDIDKTYNWNENIRHVLMVFIESALKKSALTQ